jgi:diaminopimelate epimerase
MIVYNADGTRPEACGNGLRVLGRHAHDVGHLGFGTHAVATDAGRRSLELTPLDPDVVHVRAFVVRPFLVDPNCRVENLPGLRAGARVDAGNPHLVLFVDDPESADLDGIGRAAQGDPRFPSGVNVELIAVRDGSLAARVFERGVGETGSCGSGACAAALAARRLGFCSEARIPVSFPGGELVVELDEVDGAWLSGPIEFLGTGRD